MVFFLFLPLFLHYFFSLKNVFKVLVSYSIDIIKNVAKQRYYIALPINISFITICHRKIYFYQHLVIFVIF